jgi:RNB domain
MVILKVTTENKEQENKFALVLIVTYPSFFYSHCFDFWKKKTLDFWGTPIIVGVHIADVTYFVPHNSSLDLEAQERSTTFYLVDRRYDMLPSLLSSNLCSLHDNIDRFAVSVIWIMSSDFTTIKSTWYGRTIIHNCAGKIENKNNTYMFLLILKKKNIRFRSCEMFLFISCSALFEFLSFYRPLMLLCFQ